MKFDVGEFYYNLWIKIEEKLHFTRIRRCVLCAYIEHDTVNVYQNENLTDVVERKRIPFLEMPVGFEIKLLLHDKITEVVCSC